MNTTIIVLYCSGGISAAYIRGFKCFILEIDSLPGSRGCAPPPGDARNAIVVGEVLHNNNNIRIVPIINVRNNLNSRVCVCVCECARAWSVTAAARREKSPTPPRLYYYYYYTPFVCWWESISPVIYNFGNFCFTAPGDAGGGAVVGPRTTTVVVGRAVAGRGCGQSI